MSKETFAISPTREENYPEWYQSVVKEAELAEHSPVRGCMVIRPWGYAIWENIQRVLDKAFKKTGHKNAYFPLFIPLSYLEKEAEHVEGFAKECAVVTHHRLEKGPDGKLIPGGKLEEPLVVRPTSETIIGEMFAQWITSYRDLPLLINQWCNVVRWEMRTRLFLRTAEILWQEGHTAHATHEEAERESRQMLQVYADFCHNYLAIPVIQGEKTPGERFPGAWATYTIEMMMQDGKALQGGTSHHLGQNFAKASNIKFQTETGEEAFVHTTSWGLTTRLIGAMVMTHGDDDGMILPPKIASAQIVIIPILHGKGRDEEVLQKARELKQALEEHRYHGKELEVVLDDREKRGGEKTWEWIKKGVPFRVEIGPKDIDQGSICIMQRHRPHKEKTFMPTHEFIQKAPLMLDQMQEALFENAKARNAERIFEVHSKEAFYEFFKTDEIKGFIRGYWSGEPWIEEKIKQDLNVTIRCIPFDQKGKEGVCVISGKRATVEVIYAKAY